jgi:quercetin dioxygenase-like cupin family protein
LHIVIFASRQDRRRGDCARKCNRLARAEEGEAEMPTKRYRFVPPGGGKDYDWSRDHTFVKVAAADSGGAFALMEDNLKAEFALGLHLHRQHAETFYILDGVVNFYIDGDWFAAAPGACVHIPPDVPHALDLPAHSTARLLMIFQPAGFDQFLAELARLSEAELADGKLMARLNEKYDIINIGDVPPRP